MEQLIGFYSLIQNYHIFKHISLSGERTVYSPVIKEYEK